MIKYRNRKKNKIFKKSVALIVAGALLCSAILPPYAFAYRKGGMPFQAAKSAENHNVRNKSNLIGDMREARRVLLKESFPHGSPEILSDVIEELFVVPYREFLDTFDPIQFFKSHEQQTVGQAIGIVLIWGAMVATMIGAPFGVDFLLSGNSTAHIGHDLIASLIGSLSILAGTILNQIKEKEVQLSEIKTNREPANELGQDREKINRFIQTASHLKELIQNHNFNRTQKIILSVAYLSYPPNFLAHHLYNLISNLTRPFGKRGLAPLTKGVKVYYWDTREQGIENVREILKRYRPGIMERYDDLENLQPFEIKRLRNDIYKITYGHFQVWGLSRARKQSAAPYFHGSYKEALKAVFPNLELKPLGFQLDWSSLEKAIETLRYVLSQEIPSIIERYDKINRLTSQEIDDLRDDIYKITYGHFQAWGLGSALQQDYFNRSYIEALDKVFTDLELSPLGFQLDWSSRDKAVESIKYALSRKAPHIMQQYARLPHLSARELHNLRNEIYGITYGHFQVWGIARAMDIPYFNGNYMDALIAVFNDPRVGLSKYEFENFRRQTTVVRYSWKSGREGAISNFRDALQKNMPDLLEQYENLYKLSQHEVELLKKNIYSITQGHFNIWGLSTALSQRDVPYFHGSFVEALIPLFPDLELNPLGFRLDWSTKERAVESFRYILSQEVPFIIERYENLNNLSPREINDLRSDIYKITSLDFQLWGLGSVSSQKAVPFFHGSYIEALIALFPDLKLNPLGFKLDWSSKENAINSVRYTLAQEYPGLVERYDQLNQLSLQEANDLKDDIYKISNGHFLVWGLSNALHIKDVPYFDGSYVNVLIALFSDLGLTREGFLQKSGSNGAALTTESTHSEALKRGMNPDGWIAQLFFAPHYEFMDTFDPVQFFNSHREQALSQVIGIVLIWGAMVATMIGAPFGVDYLLSGSPTTHLCVTIIGSGIGALSILAGIILNQIKEKEVQYPNRIQKLILSIVYLSYPPNFFAHHLYNLISNLTRPLGRWRFVPLTKGVQVYYWDTREQGIENVREVIRKNRPDLLERYEELSHLPSLEREGEQESLRNEIYGITKGHFDVWGLISVSNKKQVPYFQGSFIFALMAVFPDLNLNPLGFWLDWSNEEKAIESVRYVLWIEIPHIMQQYEKLNQLTDIEAHQLRDAIYEIKAGHLNVWGLSNAINRKVSPYFHGNYSNVLIAVFPELNLHPLGFQLDWSSKKKEIESVRFVLIREAPDLIGRYENLVHLSRQEREDEAELLRNKIYKISKGHFMVWGLGGGLKYFKSYIKALQEVFPDLNLDPLGFQLDWSNREKAIQSIQYVLNRQIPHLILQYDRLSTLNSFEIEELKNAIYRINRGLFRSWGFGERGYSLYFSGHIDILIEFFSKLNLNPLGFQLDWTIKEKAIESIRYVLAREAPFIMEQYARIGKLGAREIQELRNRIYGIKQAHFSLWGLSGAIDTRVLPDFQGNYRQVLLAIFNNSKLGLTLQGFSDHRRSTYERRYVWKSLESGLWNVREAIRANRPDILERYENLSQLNEKEIKKLIVDIYGISAAHFNVWGVGGALVQRIAPYFNGSYIKALMMLFPDLELNRLGFRLDWTTKEKGIESVRYVLNQFRPDLIQRYNNRHHLNHYQLDILINEIYNISSNHFDSWGLNSVMDRHKTEYFNGSYIKALTLVFPDLDINPLGFQLDWSSPEKGIESVKYVLNQEIPHIMQQYERLDRINESDIRSLKKEIYRITYGHFALWGLSEAMNRKKAPYFYGSYVNVLMAVFPDLNLNSLGFGLKWENENGKSDINVGIESVKYVLNQEIPHIMHQYERLDRSKERDLRNLRNKIYAITAFDFEIWGLGAALNWQLAPYFYGSHVNILMAVFPDLDMNPLGFRLDWSSRQKGIESVKYVLSYEVPHIIRQYERIDHLTDRELQDLRNAIYGITQGHFTLWGLGAARIPQTASYFKGTHIDALLEVFSHPKLGLTREAFSRKSGSSVDPLTTESTRSEAVRRGINPNNWITQLFFAPHYEFLDTFDPVRFFKSHREQTVGQVIGILLIWGAMIATMIGAPFGIDYLMSGNPTTHLGITLLTSTIGALSIFSGIRLNQIQNRHNFNRMERTVLFIAYLSYPINFLTHHLYNLISNFTRALGKWRLAPLTEDNGTAKTELYHWGTEEQGIENVRDALSKNRPELLERYSNLESLLPREREQERKSLKTEVYKISSSHFQYWGIHSALDRQRTPYFEGSYIRALMAVFPELELEPLDIQLNWSSPDKAMESILYVLMREIPHLVQLYNRLPELDPAKVEALKDEIYQITSAHFDVWGLANVGSKKHVPYFNGRYIHALMAVFADLDLNPLGFELEWSSFERGVESVLYVFKKHVPYLIERYERLNELTDLELNNLRREICAITKAHFTSWSLGSAMSQRPPYFNGSYKNVLIAVFPKLNLNPLEFQLDWSSRERALDSIRFVLAREAPHLLNQYDQLRDLSPRQKERLKDEIYKITSAHFDVWGLCNATNKRSAPYFNGSYIEALMALFPDLDLNPLGFELDWSSKQRAIDSIRFVIDREAPSLIERYDHIERLSPGEIQILRNNIYSITQAHFALWGLGRAQIRSSVPEFEGSYMKALVEVFNHPRLGLSLQGFSDFRKSTWEIKYSWQTVESGIFNVRDALMRNMPDLVMRYDQLNHLSESEKNELRDDFYRITQAHFNLWGLRSAVKRERAPYFHGTYSGALSVVFPDLNLNPLGFELEWSSRARAIESLKFVFSKKRPDLIEQYDHRFQMNPHRIRALRNEIYGITYGHFMFWGLAGAINRNRAPYFNGSHVEALMALFPALHLNPLGFELSWSTKEKGIESVQFMLARGIPSIVQQYERVDELDEDGVEELKNRIYALDEADLKMWGLSRAMHMDSAPYFNGSYIEALIAVFPKLNLNSLGFKLDWSSKERALDSVKFVFTQKVSHLMQLYLKIENLSDLELALLREGIYRIKRAHLLLWKLGGFFSDTTYFDDSIDLLINLFSHPKLGLSREGFAGQANNSSTSTDSSTDILEPLVQPLKRFKSWSSLGAYYLFTGSWEELLFRWGGVVGLPILFSSLGVNPILSQITGLVLSAVGFLFSHTILRWLVKRNSVDWHGWKTELKKDFFSLRTFHALLYNALFISIISFQPALVSFALGSVISLHFTIDMINAYKKKRLTPQELLSPEIQLIADELGTAESELKSLSFSSDLKFSDTVQILFGAWTIEPKVKKLYLADLTGVKDQGSQVALLRAIHEIYLANMNARFILVMEEPQSVKELESVLGVKGIVSVVSNPEEAIAQTKIVLKQGSYAVGLIAGSGKIGIWSKLLDGLGKGVKEIRILVLQILDVGTTIKILLPQDRILNTNVKDWIKNLEAEGRIEQNGRELTIRGVPFEPPTPSEEHQLQTLFSSQA